MEYVQYTSETVPAEKILDALSAFLGSVRFDQWFGSEAQVRLTENALVFGIKNQFCIDWIRSNLLRKIEEFSLAIFGKSYPVIFEVVKPAEKKVPVSEKIVVPSVTKELVLSGTGAVPHFAAQRAFDFHSEFAPPTTRSLSHRQNSPLQSPEKKTTLKPSRSRSNFATLDTFVEGLSNRLACRAVDLAVHHPGEINPIYLFGPTSVGKTHLLEGIWSAIRRRNEKKLPLYMTCEQFVSSYLDAIPKAGFSRDKVNLFRDRFKNISIFLFDGIHQLDGKGATQSEFLILFDQVQAKRRRSDLPTQCNTADLPVFTHQRKNFVRIPL